MWLSVLLQYKFNVLKTPAAASSSPLFSILQNRIYILLLTDLDQSLKTPEKYFGREEIIVENDRQMPPKLKRRRRAKNEKWMEQSL